MLVQAQVQVQVQVQEAGDAQVCIHLDEGTLGLGEEVVDDALGELALSLVLVHLEDLLEGRLVDGIFCAGNRHDAFADFADFAAVHALWRSGQSGVRRGVRRAGAGAGAGAGRGEGRGWVALEAPIALALALALALGAVRVCLCLCMRARSLAVCAGAALPVRNARVAWRGATLRCAALSWAGSAGLSSAVC